MENRIYTNKELAQAYFEIKAQNSTRICYVTHQKDRDNIANVEENMQNHFITHGDLYEIEINRIRKAGKKGKETREMLVRILVEGKDAVKKELKDREIGLDFLR